MRRIDPYSVDPVYCCLKVSIRCAIWLIILYEICFIIFSVYVEILPYKDINKTIRVRNPLFQRDGEWIYNLRLAYLLAMYLLTVFVFFYHFARYLTTRGDGMGDEPEHRRILVKGMDCLLFRVITETVVLVISNIIYAEYVKNLVIFLDFKWPLQIGILRLILTLWWRSAFQKYYIQLVPNVHFQGIQIVEPHQSRSLFDFIEAPLPNPNKLPTQIELQQQEAKR